MEGGPAGKRAEATPLTHKSIGTHGQVGNTSPILPISTTQSVWCGKEDTGTGTKTEPEMERPDPRPPGEWVPGWDQDLECTMPQS